MSHATHPQPTVLVRTPYGRIGMYGRLLAERGLQVVMQSVRGTFGSGGEFNPFDERADGLATLLWIAQQRWHRGQVGTTGASYLGLVQWALALEAGPILGAMATSVSASQFHGQVHAGGSISLQSMASWLVLVAAQERRFAPVRMLQGLQRLPAMLDELPSAISTCARAVRRSPGTAPASSRSHATTPTGSRATTPQASGLSRRPYNWSAAGTTSSCHG